MIPLSSFRIGSSCKRIILVFCVSIIAIVFSTGAHVAETRPWPAPPVTQAQVGPSITGPMVAPPSAAGDSYEVGETVTGEFTYDAPTPSHRGPTNLPDPRTQDDPLPVVTLSDISPSPVREGSSLRVTLNISPTATKRIEGGVIAFDSSKGDGSGALHAFVFRAGDDEVRAASYFVTDDGVNDPSRTITIMINGAFDGYRVGSPPYKISVLDTTEEPEPTSTPTPTPTPEPTPVPTPEPTPEPTQSRHRNLLLYPRQSRHRNLLLNQHPCRRRNLLLYPRPSQHRSPPVPTPKPTPQPTPVPTPEPQEYDESGDDASNEGVDDSAPSGGSASGSGNSPVESPPETQTQNPPETPPEGPVTSPAPPAVPEPVPEPPSQVTQTSRTDDADSGDTENGGDDVHVGSAPTPTPTSTPTPTPTITPTPTSTPPPIPTSTPTPTPTVTPTPTSTPTPTPTPTTTPKPTALPTPTQRPLPTLTPTSTPVVVATAVPEITPTPPGDELTKEALSPNLERPGLPVIGNAVPRIRNALAGIAATPRQRTTLIVILASPPS